VTQPPPWHGLVVWDVLLNALTTGLFLAAAVGELAAPGALARVAARAYPLALVLLIADLSCLVLDLGNRTRFHHMLRVFKPASPMSLGTWFLTAYALPLTLLVALDVFTQIGWLPGASPAVREVRTVLLVVGLPVAFGSMAYKGVLFSTTAQPGWRDARWLGAYHAASALALGAAVLLLLALLTGDGPAVALRPAVAALVVVQAVPLALLAAELRPALARRYSRGERALTAVLATAGVLVPVPVLLTATGPLPTSVAGGLVLAAGWAVRRAVVLLPQAAAHAPSGPGG
jgi:hypothetical protein